MQLSLMRELPHMQLSLMHECLMQLSAAYNSSLASSPMQHMTNVRQGSDDLHARALCLCQLATDNQRIPTNTVMSEHIPFFLGA